MDDSIDSFDSIKARSLAGTLVKLDNSFGVTGDEEETAEALKEEMRGLYDEYFADAQGNQIYVRYGKNRDKRVLLSAHMDEIGYIIKSIDKSGFARIFPVGFHDDRMAINQVLVFRTAEGKKVQGVTGAKPAHIVPEEERGKTPIGELFVDFGSRSAEETRSLGLEIGDYGTFDRAGIKFYEDSVCVFRLSMTNTTLSACGYSSVTIDFTSRARSFFVRCRDADTYRVLPFIMVFVHRYRPPLLPRKLYRLFIHADYRPSLIIRPEIHPRHLLPVRRKRRILLRRYAPALFLMRFQGCFF